MFNEATIQVIYANKELFAGAFQNGLRAAYFIESLTQNPVDSMEDIMSRAEYQVKEEEINIEKIEMDANQLTRERSSHKILKGIKSLVGMR